MRGGAEELRSRLEVLLGAKGEAPVDQTQRRAATAASSQEGSEAKRERVAAAGGALFGAVFQFLGALAPETDAAPLEPVVEGIRKSLAECVEVDDAGRPRLTLTLPDRDAVDQLAQTLARLLAGQTRVG